MRMHDNHPMYYRAILMIVSAKGEAECKGQWEIARLTAKCKL